MNEEAKFKRKFFKGGKLASQNYRLYAPEMYRTTEQIAEFAKNALKPRGYVANYHLNPDKVTDESIAAHAHLMEVMVDRALGLYYGANFGNPEAYWPRTIDGYSYREIMEAIRIHDLPENDFGDWPDNGNRNEELKSRCEDQYLNKFSAKYPMREYRLRDAALELFHKMDDKTSPTGRLLKVADKTAALIITLTYDRENRSPQMHEKDNRASEKDLTEMRMCDYGKKGWHRASEMWTIDHLHIRKFNEIDDTGFFTALLVMYTLMIHNKWYSWRKKDYQK